MRGLHGRVCLVAFAGEGVNYINLIVHLSNAPTNAVALCGVKQAHPTRNIATFAVPLGVGEVYCEKCLAHPKVAMEQLREANRTTWKQFVVATAPPAPAKFIRIVNIGKVEDD